MSLVIINPNLQRGSHDTKVGSGETHWEYSPVHEAYIWQGRELTDEEHNKVIARIIKMSLQIAPWKNSPVYSRSIPSETPKVDVQELQTWQERALEARQYGDIARESAETTKTLLAFVTGERDGLQAKLESILSAQPVAVKKKSGRKPNHTKSEEEIQKARERMKHAREVKLAAKQFVEPLREAVA